MTKLIRIKFKPKNSATISVDPFNVMAFFDDVAAIVF